MDQATLKEHNYPTIFDYEDAARVNEMTLVDEIKGQSQLVLDAAVIPTNQGFSHEINRVIEKKYEARAAAMDEGWVSSGGTRTMKVSFPTMRVTDAKEFHPLTARLTSDGGAAQGHLPTLKPQQPWHNTKTSPTTTCTASRATRHAPERTPACAPSPPACWKRAGPHPLSEGNTSQGAAAGTDR